MSGSKIGFLATGDEVCDGDITNTNTPALSRLLHEHGWQIGNTLCVPDDEEHIIQGLTYLADKHDAIITTGGLGPTEDDRTRFALARFVNQPLEFNDASWQRLYDRLHNYLKLPVPDNNRQQALFPQKATVLANDRGSADSCWTEHNNIIIFMLPGPPHECIGVMHDHVLPILAKHPKLKRTSTHLLKWLLLGASEGHVAEKIEEVLQEYNCRTGYRADYPYLECKVWVDDQTQRSIIQKTVENVLQDYCLLPTTQIASHYCHNIIAQQQQLITICDNATAGQLQSRLTSEKTYSLLRFQSQQDDQATYHLHITGLNEFWQANFSDGLPKSGLTTTVQLTFRHNNSEKIAEKTIPIRSQLSISYATEWISYQLAQWLI